MKEHDKYEECQEREVLNIEQLESRLEMESVAALAAPPSGGTTPVSICHF